MSPAATSRGPVTTSVDKLFRAAQRAAVRTGRGPLRPVWAVAHRALIWTVARWVTAGSSDARAYLKGSFGLGRPVYGLSDVDLVVVVDHDPARPGLERERVEQRWRSLVRRVAAFGELFQLWVYESADLNYPETTTYLTIGTPAFVGREAPHDPLGLLERPGAFGQGRDWRKLGSRSRAPATIGDQATRAVFAWLEVQFLWGYAFLTVADPATDGAAYMCQKLVADSAATWLSLRYGEPTLDRPESLARALEYMPDEEEALTLALALGRRLPRRPTPPLASVLPFLVRTTSKIAAHLAMCAEAARTTAVRLVWGGPDELLVADDVCARAVALGAAGGRRGLVPLADWRARAIPGLLDPALAIVPGDPGDPDRLAELTRAGDDYFFPALQRDGLLVMPTTEIWHAGRLRRIQCTTTDPVSITLAAGEETALFPNLPGWSVHDSARRAIDEHRGWLELGAGGEPTELLYWVRKSPCPELTELSGLLTAARAALFADSLTLGSPALPLTARAIVDCLAEQGSASRIAAESAYEELEACRGSLRAPDPRPVTALRDVVGALPAYASSP